jgi:hypothetical protein
MQTSRQVLPAVPSVKAPALPTVPNSVTITGSDGTSRTIVIQNGTPVIAAESDAPALAEVPPPPGSDDDTFAQGATAGAVGTLIVLGIIFMYRKFKRRGAPARAQQIPAESSERMERVERGMEAIAIEIERISEGQRFVTKLLSDSRAPAIPVEQTRPIG